MIIHGDVTKIYEIERDAYTQPISGGGGAIAYTFGATLAGTSTGYLNIAYPLYSTSPILLHMLQVTSQDTTAVQRVYIVRYPDVTVLFDSYFFFTDTPKEFSLGDIRLDLSLAGGESFRLYLENNNAAPRWFEGAIWIIST